MIATLPRIQVRAASPATYREAARHAGSGAAADTSALPTEWEAWFRAVSPGLSDFAPHHRDAGAWLQAIAPDVRPTPRVDVWPRGHGKSTFAEHGVAYVGEQRKRRFALYVCDTQDAANRHVQSVQTLLERIGQRTGSPIGQRLENQYGHSRGWRPSAIRTASGFNVLAFGLDQAMRGVKLDDYRPDLIVFDDVDGRHDSLAVTRKKIEILTESLLPAGSDDCAIWGVQNLIIPHGIFSQLADGRAEFLAARVVCGPVRAVEGLRTERRYVEAYKGRPVGRTIHVITGGRATWAGCDLDTCQDEIVDFGWRAFDREKQQNVKDVEGALWTTEMINRSRIAPADLPGLSRVVVAVDPASTSKQSSDETGVGACGRTADRHGYVLRDESGIMRPAEWGRRAVLLHDEVGADCIVAESNQGGEMVEDVIRNAAERLHAEGLRPSPKVRVKLVHASRGKRARAEPVAQMYDEDAVHHVGDFPGLEEQMTTWNAGDGSESPDRVDWLVWGMTELGIVKTSTLNHGRV